MPPVLLDRYLVINADQACDLATGTVVAIDGLTERRVAHSRSPDGLIEVLEHGRDGEPRLVTAELRSSAWKPEADRIAADAVDRGYVPIVADLYRRMLLVLVTTSPNARCSCWRPTRTGPWRGRRSSMRRRGRHGRTCC